MEKLFPIGNQMIDTRICYAKRIGFEIKEVRTLWSQVHLHNRFVDLSFVYLHTEIY